MTDVGKISLGVELHADDLAARLGEAVRRAILPTLDKLNRKLNETQREYRNTGNAAERSADKQVRQLRRVAAEAGATAAAVRAANEVAYGSGGAAVRRSTEATRQTNRQRQATDGLANSTRSVAEAQNELNAAIDIFGRRSPVVEAAQRRLSRMEATHTAELLRAAARSRASTDSQVNDYERLAREAERSAARQAAAARAAGGGGGRGGGGGGRRGGVLGFLTGPTGLNTIALGAQALPAVATGVVNIVGAVQQLAQAGAVLPGVFAGGAAAIGTAVIGFKGMGDAVKALMDAADDPAKLEEANKQLEKMAPAAAAVAREVAKLAAPNGPLRQFQKDIAQPMFEGIDQQLDDFAGKVLPRVKPGAQKIAGAWNNTFKEAMRVGSSDSTLGFIDRIFGNTAEGQNRATKAIEPLTHALGQLSATGSDFLPRLGDAITSVSERLDKFISKNAANGNLFRWIDEGLNGMRAFGNAVLNVFKTITGLTKAAGALDGSLSGDGGFLGWLERATKAMSDLTNSASGQAKLTAFFRDGREDLKRWGELFREVWPALREIIKGFQQWGEITFPIIKAIGGLAGSLAEVPGLLQAVLVGFLAWRTIGGIVGGITGKIKAMNTAAAAGGGAAGGGFGKGQSALLGGSLLLSGTTMQQNAGTSTTSGVLGALQTIGGGAVLGGTIGSVIPGVGTGIGALVGGGLGAALAGYNALVNQNKIATEAAAAAAEKWAATNERSHQAMLLNSQAIKSMNDALAESGGAIDAATLAAVGEQVSAIPEKLAGAYDENTLKGIATALGDVGMSTEQMAATITGSQGQFDALINRLQGMGPAGQIAAQQLASIRDNTLGAAQNAAAAAPLLQQLADKYGGMANAQVAIENAFAAIPKDVPININMPNGQAVFDILKDIGAQIKTNEDGTINVTAPLAPSVLDQLRALGIQVQQNKDGTINVQVDPAKYADTLAKLGTLGSMLRDLHGQSLGLPPVPGPANPNTQAANPFELPRPGGADGMVIPGYAPGHDIVNAVLAPGEGVLIPEAVRGIGGPAGVYALNSRFRSGLSKRFYADGGVHLGTGALPGPPPGAETELGVLIQIRDLLAGKGGIGAVAQTASATDTIAKASTGTTGQTMGPFGTPIKARNRGYEAAAAAIQALGGDPEKWIGADPTTYVAPTASGALGGTTAALPGMVDIAALQKFAMTGNTADLPPGMSLNDPVVTAITGARNKKKGLSDQGISDLIGQALAPGGYTGTLDSNNTSLVKALERLRTKGVKMPTGGTAAVAGSTGVPMYGIPGGVMDPISAYAQAHSGGQYSWGASDLAAGLSDCSGAVSDLVEIITQGQATSKRLFSTADAGSVLSSLGAVSGAVPGALQIGWSAEHMRATLPNGVNFESGGGTGQGATYGGNAKGAAGMPNIMSLPVNGVPLGAGMSGALPGGATAGSGTPVFVTNWPGQGQLPPGVNQILGGLTQGGGEAAQNVLGDVMGAVAGVGQEGWATKGATYAQLNQLVKEGNPLALAKAFGLNVEDFTRQGGAGTDVEKNDQAYDASGRLFSDTSALFDRTLTSLNAQLQAMREQMVDVIEQVSQKLNDEALEPVVKAGVQNALEGLKDSVSNAIGTAMGNAAAPPIADAVSSAVASLPIDNTGSGNVGGNLAGAATGVIGMAGGGPVSGGIAGKDSVPALLMPGEFVLNTMDVARMGGTHGVEAARRKGFRHYATGGGVIGNDTVGADFFGVSEVPIIGAIVNLLVRVLLQVIGVQIEVRDTMNEMTDDFRQFRGDAFKAFDAQGRLLNDTSGLIERTQSSEETAAEERIRILKIVIQALIKYIIEKVIVPITKAVANAAIQAGASAAGAAVNTQAPGAGGIVSSLISSAGQAGVDIAAEVGTDFALAISETLIDMVGDQLQSSFPDLMAGVFGGGALASIFDPAGGILGTIIGGLLGSLTAVFGGLFGGASTLIPGQSFDQGGLAIGEGYLPKATAEPELVLSPTETSLFSRFVAALERGGFGGGGSRTVHAPITVIGGGTETADVIEQRLLKLMP
ncbi:tail length tape measure protein [Mycobacterium phage BrownCNA]|uniref:Tape measure protein n=4 Tax=Coopervirus brownCNA TaxID=1983108 RepID=A0A5Q2WQD6_9CAUD|nr:tail length tape measure protein [Mycobacterium phage BrownCNA]AKY02739.1 tape measure protein [Mycobacterium phage BrownCNA]QGH80118.1 tape measure protein [Mycobacterium phage Mithril]QOC58585.1 tape measure protein [Mycobacterium phage Lolalove]QQV92919.1 tape measure protein [Mycobacterium phage Hydro]